MPIRTPSTPPKKTRKLVRSYRVGNVTTFEYEVLGPPSRSLLDRIGTFLRSLFR